MLLKSMVTFFFESFLRIACDMIQYDEMKMYFALFLMHTLALLLIDVFIFPIWSYVAHRNNAAFP